MPEQNQRIDFETTATHGDCPQCGLADCDHFGMTDPIADNAERRRLRREELPPELAEFASDYQVEGLLGEGGMSSVYKVVHRALDQPMAIKMLHSHLVRDMVQIKRFEQEAQALFRLEHPNIVKLRNFGFTSTGKPYLIMDFLEGSPLSEVLKKNGPIPVHRALRLFSQICDGLEHAHSKSIVHRDIKPSNIILSTNADGSDRVRIVDFGIAKFNQDEINPGLTQTGDVFGSPLYMSPEQCLGHKLDQRSDIYALGCVMYEMLSGQPPLSGESALSTIHKHTSEMPKPLQVPDCDSKLRERLDEIIFKTLEKDPDRRYQNIVALRREIEELMKDTGYRKGAGYYVRYARFYRHILNIISLHPVKFIAALAVVIALGSYGTYWIFSYCNNVMQAPTELNKEIAWVWTEQPVDPPTIHLQDQIRKAEYFISRSEDRLGASHPEVFQRKQSFAKYLISFGYWTRAIDYLLKARQAYKAKYGEADALLPDINALIGDCYLQQNDFTNASIFYELALREYLTVNAGNHAKAMTRLKLAIALLRNQEVERAYAYFQDQLRTSGRSKDFESVVAITGIADCMLYKAEVEGHSTVDRKSDLLKARNAYESVAKLWLNFSEHDSLVAYLRVADTRILEGDMNHAVADYEKVMEKEVLFNDTELATIKRNFARLLWRTHNWSQALKMDDEATLAAKKSNEILRNRTKSSQNL